MDNIQAAIDAARNAAGNISQDANAVMAGGGGTAVGSPLQKGPPIGLDDLLQGSLNVVSWIKVNELGLRIGNDNTLFDTLNVVIPMHEVGYHYSIRYGNPAQYDKTFDRMTSARGGSWMDAMARAQRVDPKAREYPSADIPFYLLETVKNKKNEVIVEKGQAIGHTLAVTGWAPFAAFIKKLQAQKMNERTGLIQIKLGFEEKKNQHGTWGVLAFNDPVELEAFPWEVN